jgi:hypothetical protein
MSQQAVIDVLDKLFSELGTAIHPEASQSVQFAAGELHKLKTAFDAWVAEIESPAPDFEPEVSHLEFVDANAIDSEDEPAPTDLNAPTGT